MSGSAIRAGVLLPPRDVLSAMSGEVAAVLSAFADEMREPRIELAFAAPEGTAEERAGAARRFVEQDDMLALVASFTDGADAEIATEADALGVPLLATLSSAPRSSIAPARCLRDLCGGMIEQAVALVRHTAPANVALLHADGAVAAAVAGQCPAVRPIDAASASAGELRASGADALLFAGAAAQPLRIIDELQSLRWWPPLLFAGAAVPPALFDRVRPAGGVWLAFPTSARDQSPAALTAYLEMVRRHRIPTEHRFSQFAAVTSLALFADAARRCGAHPTRDALLRAIDETRGFHSGLFPRLTYGAERHIGSTGAWIIAAHKGRGAEPVWVE